MGLREIIEHVQKDIEAVGTGVSEADARSAFITPILAELGWSGLSRIRVEYKVKYGNGILDYALMGPLGTPVAFVEAKKPGEQLETHIEQVVNYAFQEAVNICVLTTGVVWRMYLPMENVPWPDRQFSELDLRVENASKLSESLQAFLSYEELTSGHSVKRAKDLLLAEHREERIRKEIPNSWRLLHSESNELLIELIQEEVQSAIGERPSQAQVARFLTEVVAQPANGNAGQKVSSGRRALLSTSIQRAKAKGEPGAKAPATTVVALRLWGKDFPVGNQKQAFTLAVDLVYERHHHEFNNVIHTVAGFRYNSIEGLNAPYQIADSDYYVAAGLSFQDKQKRLSQLLRVFGYDESEVELVTV